jgi:hypothetical protein
MRKTIMLVLLVAAATAAMLAACSNQYPDTVMLCKGSVQTWINGQLGAKMENESIGMHLSNDRISLTGNGLQGIDEQKVCRIGSIEFAKKDELFFDSDGCSMKNVSEVRKAGTYNLITRHLSFSVHFPPTGMTWSDGDYECSEAKR